MSDAQQAQEALLSKAVRTVQIKIVDMLWQFRQLEQDQMLDLERLQLVLQQPAPDEAVQSQLLLLLFEYFESAARTHFISAEEYKKLENLTQRREEELRTYIRVEQQLRLHMDSQTNRIRTLEKLKEDRIRLMRQVQDLEKEKVKTEKKYEQKLEQIMRRATLASIEQGSPSSQMQPSKKSLELNMSKIQELSKPRNNKARIRRGSVSVLSMPKLSLPSLPHLKINSQRNSHELMEKLIEQESSHKRKHTKSVKSVLQSEHNAKFELLKEMNLLLKAPNSKSIINRYYQDGQSYYQFEDSHIR